MAPEIVFEEVTKTYNKQRALDAVSLRLEGNVTTSVVGPSGSGKSTLLQLINGLERPDTGSIRVDGNPIDYHRLPEMRRGMGYAVQGTGLFPHLNVFRNISLLAALAGWEKDRIRERVATLMELVDLPSAYVRRYPYELSGGEQQRVGLCRAMMLNPRFLLLDEPFGALDPITRNEIHREFLKLQQPEPRTVVLVTHDLREAIKLGQNLVILDKGKVVQRGSCEEVARSPANDFVRDLLNTQLFDTPIIREQGS
jgi:osmoprotectant transport system ATP-binding protein